MSVSTRLERVSDASEPVSSIGGITSAHVIPRTSSSTTGRGGASGSEHSRRLGIDYAARAEGDGPHSRATLATVPAAVKGPQSSALSRLRRAWTSVLKTGKRASNEEAPTMHSSMLPATLRNASLLPIAPASRPDVTQLSLDLQPSERLKFSLDGQHPEAWWSLDSSASLTAHGESATDLCHIGVSPYSSTLRVPAPGAALNLAASTSTNGSGSATLGASVHRSEFVTPRRSGTTTHPDFGASQSTQGPSSNNSSPEAHNPLMHQLQVQPQPRLTLPTHVSIISNLSSFQEGSPREDQRRARRTAVAKGMFFAGFLVPMCWLVGGWLLQRRELHRRRRGDGKNTSGIRERLRMSTWSGPEPANRDPELAAVSAPDTRLDMWVRRCRIASFVGGIVILAACIAAGGVAAGVKS
ncbi:hypothetical protein EXIGLDRAFT_726820 [Exidia glandulosa HHB12029]|uniref:Uncharacterized protein n=1 Tax=Exidia glandulosa HHB12029 TaxID=1314781 RepID=A0A165M906_EXIGL|nr:hypothetical protein EXIGLDRAFT_726820 [Exidia glandulosa HHB12029]